MFTRNLIRTISMMSIYENNIKRQVELEKDQTPEYLLRYEDLLFSFNDEDKNESDPNFHHLKNLPSLNSINIEHIPSLKNDNENIQVIEKKINLESKNNFDTKINEVLDFRPTKEEIANKYENFFKLTSKSIVQIIQIILQWKQLASEDNQIDDIDLKKFYCNDNLKAIENSKSYKELLKYTRQDKKIEETTKFLTLTKNWFRDLLIKDVNLINYCKSKSNPNNFEIVKYIVKNLIFKSEPIFDFLKEENYFFEFTDEVIQRIILKFIQEAPAIDITSNNNFFFQLKCSNIDKKDYFENLYLGTLSNWNTINKKIEKILQNWDINRVFSIDKILIFMASYEIIYLKTHPKIIINEYLNIAKKFSSEQSNFFINGILDKLSKNL